MKKTLKNSDVKKLSIECLEKYGAEIISKKDRIEKDEKFIYSNGKAVFFFSAENREAPTLKILQRYPDILPKAVVDKGAIRFMVNGADVMRPGITEMEDFSKDDFVAIVDEEHNKPLAVGKALFSSEEIKAMSSGKVLQNLHYVGDSIWENG